MFHNYRASAINLALHLHLAVHLQLAVHLAGADVGEYRYSVLCGPAGRRSQR